MTDYTEMTADELVAHAFDALAEAQAAHYTSMLGGASMSIRDQRAGSEGNLTAINGGQARVHADFMLGMAGTLFTAALATGGEFEYAEVGDDDEDEATDGPPQ